MPVIHQSIDMNKFRDGVALPFNLRVADLQMAMQDVYDFFYDVNTLLEGKGLERIDDMLRPAIMSGMLSDMLTASLAKHSRGLTQNRYFNGHPDLVVKGRYANDSVKAGTEGIEIKTTRKRGGAVDMHGAREQWLCVFVYDVDNTTEPATRRVPMRFMEVYVARVRKSDFRHNERGELGTRTATLDRSGLERFRKGLVYAD